MKMMKKLLMLGWIAPFFVACSAEDPVVEESSIEVTEGLHQSYDFQSEDLVGTWNVVSMESDIPVDLDLDTTQNTDIMAEVDCFDTMFFTFDLDGGVSTQQSRLFFETESGAMTCDSGTYNALYQLNGNILTVDFSVRGVSYTETRTIDVYEVNNEQFLQVDLTYEEAQVYFSNPDFVSPTGATNVRAVTMLFKKI